MCRREVHQKITGGERDRDSPPKVGSTDPRWGSDDCCTDIGCRPWSYGQYESSNGRCAIVIWMFTHVCLSTSSADGKASTESIREDLGMCLTQGRPHSCWHQVIVSIHQTLNKINKTQRLLLYFPHFVAVTDGIFVGDRLQKDVQHWLSPPNPSTNQNFVRKARHKGTAAWFFASSALTEWKAKGSLLWIHGKRTCFKPPISLLL